MSSISSSTRMLFEVEASVAPAATGSGVLAMITLVVPEDGSADTDSLRSAGDEAAIVFDAATRDTLELRNELALKLLCDA